MSGRRLMVGAGQTGLEVEACSTMGHERLLSPLWQALSQVPPPQP